MSHALGCIYLYCYIYPEARNTNIFFIFLIEFDVLDKKIKKLCFFFFYFIIVIAIIYYVYMICTKKKKKNNTKLKKYNIFQ